MGIDQFTIIGLPFEHDLGEVNLMKFLRRVMLSIFLTIFSQSTLADDADLNRVAKKIKTQIEKSIKKSKKPLEG
ncbi:hypothetical protein [Vibrio cholerae]|uniref:hypothetical protein n=1 Tax=Vibrio cholerae TaxID=666 RepID=UPI002DB7CBE8|nr:hypothetical protein [Vibrio cholerae]